MRAVSTAVQFQTGTPSFLEPPHSWNPLIPGRPPHSWASRLHRILSHHKCIDDIFCLISINYYLVIALFMFILLYEGDVLCFDSARDVRRRNRSRVV